MAAALVANGDAARVVRCDAGPVVDDPMVAATLDVQIPDLFDAAVEVLNQVDVAVVQHEYGIYGGVDGDVLLRVLEAITAPMVVVAHTIVRRPTAHQRFVLEQVCAAADAVVVMTESARHRLGHCYEVEGSRIVVIPHGAATPLFDPATAAERPCGLAARILTWGLLGPGKGIEWAIDAIAGLSDIRPHPQYIVAGATHPKVLTRDGEAYRQMLISRARATGAAPFVSFDGAYRDVDALNALIGSADLVLLPYDSEDQVTSGVLVDAVAAGRPVVSTAFPHAVELLSSGAGIVVPNRDPDALIDAIRSVVTDTALAARMAAEARRLAPELSWNAIARRYGRLGDLLLTAREQVRA